MVLVRELEPNRKLFPDHLPFILHGKQDQAKREAGHYEKPNALSLFSWMKTYAFIRLPPYTLQNLWQVIMC
jgi:hypothetical protein